MQKQRVANLRTLMAANGLDALLVTNSYNRMYLTGFTGSAGYVLVTGGRAILITDFRYMTQAPQQAAGFEVIEHPPGQEMATVRQLLAEQGIAKVGFEEQDVTYGQYRSYKEQLSGIELVPTAGWVEKLRLIKDEQELSVMREAADLADRTYMHVLNHIRRGIREVDVALELETFMRKEGATSTSFETIVASGERSALPHGKASERVLVGDEFVKLDFGAYYKAYCSDITRTVVLGKPTDKHRDIYNIVLEAQLQALERIKPGMTGKEADAIARDVIAKYGYSEYFGHGLGHGLGMEVHEAPRLSKTGDIVLEPGMVVTVEPGIYLPGFGGVRIEDDAVVTDKGLQKLTHSSKDLIVID